MRNRIALACAAAILAVATTNAWASLYAVDNASNAAYADGWQTGDNGGFGWGGGWTFRNGGNAVIPQPDPPTSSFQGTFVGDARGNNSPAGAGGDSNADGDINTAGNKAWGMYANSANELYAVRPLSGALDVGQIIRFAFDNGNVDSTRVLGIRFINNANDIATRQLEVRFVGGDSNYTVVASPNVTSTLGFSREGIAGEFMLTSPTAYSLKLTRLQSGATQTIAGNTLGGLAINAIAFRNLSAGSGATNDGYFNSISVPESASLSLLAMAAAGLCRRRRV